MNWYDNINILQLNDIKYQNSSLELESHKSTASYRNIHCIHVTYSRFKHYCLVFLTIPFHQKRDWSYTIWSCTTSKSQWVNTDVCGTNERQINTLHWGSGKLVLRAFRALSGPFYQHRILFVCTRVYISIYYISSFNTYGKSHIRHAQSLLLS